MGKKNLDSLVIKSEKILPTKEEEKDLRKKASKPKTVKERDSEVISIKITPTELAIIKEKAGELVPLGTFVKHYIRTKTDLFTKQGPNE
ncbi:hypothetical protein [Bathymodiolus platifrons methanotrophic gill symbiont]|uniref:hypothetical protein n=1 Tax=Bathymodiolus platifrons methanotrophic gill symbiont TaxID=113268 RepID=UPI001C8E713F|nr:hypothetical protein [Bathymodiolus platifrons methanotrophic gill symbiont]